MAKLSTHIREKLASLYASGVAETLRDYSGKDFYDLARGGIRGIDDMSDVEIINGVKENLQRDEQVSNEIADNQLRAMYHLLGSLDSSRDKALVRDAINDREKELKARGINPADPIVKYGRDQVREDDIEVYSLVMEAEAELAVDKMLSHDDERVWVRA